MPESSKTFAGLWERQIVLISPFISQVNWGVILSFSSAWPRQPALRATVLLYLACFEQVLSATGWYVHLYTICSSAPSCGVPLAFTSPALVCLHIVFISPLRIRIEMAFGIMVTKWQILKAPLMIKWENIPHLLGTITRLHNYCLIENGRGQKKNWRCAMFLATCSCLMSTNLWICASWCSKC